MSDKAAKRAKFEHAWTRIRDELVGYAAGEGMPKEAVEWYTKSLDYNVPGGKLNRGMSVVDTAEIIKGAKLDDDEYYKAAILGWGVELLQAFFLVSDDIMDSSITRRGQPCWYRAPGIGMIAINDGFMLESAIYYLIKKHFRSEPYYVDLLEIFHETTFQTELGQLIDLITAPEDSVDLNKFSLDKHRLIVIYKTAYYSFYLPVALAMYMSRVPASYELDGKKIEPYKVAMDILIPLGEYFQIQDDFLDFSAPPEILGKIGTDIVDNKCSWCINTALAVVTPEQRAVLDANYGKKNEPAAEQRVKDVFEAVDLRGRYAKYEAEVYGKLNALIAGIPEGPQPGTLKRAVFTSFLEKIYKRTK
ncbi:Fructose-bisphosphate aldolase [Mycena indigotica]|uniref:(2E,6E)-farnesyl diphosphate synthase n=1 Tax=Mycena indigotica TaxID=2126181 RepID=A0A8H6SLU2_9AGAR|nr:Fructose-bisphosphate aldolase [Mycena indigotica]KAF7301192.1 Fructose-bisphosphate aldolase [Mycena indigotica]